MSKHNFILYACAFVACVALYEFNNLLPILESAFASVVFGVSFFINYKLKNPSFSILLPARYILFYTLILFHRDTHLVSSYEYAGYGIVIEKAQCIGFCLFPGMAISIVCEILACIETRPWKANVK